MHTCRTLHDLGMPILLRKIVLKNLTGIEMGFFSPMRFFLQDPTRCAHIVGLKCDFSILTQDMHSHHPRSQTAPHGPRLPVHRSNTPSPERGSLHSVARTSTESTQVAPMHQGSKLRQDSSEEWTDAGADDDDCKTPVRPSAKALGKRKVVEPPEGERECLSYYTMCVHG